MKTRYSFKKFRVTPIIALLTALVFLVIPFMQKEGFAEMNADADTALYTQDFDDITQLPDGWLLPASNPAGSAVSVRDGALYIDDTVTITPAAVYFDTGDVKDYIIEADITMESSRDNARWAGICFRVQTADGWIKASIGLPSAYAINLFNKTNISGGSYTEIVKGSLEESVELNRTYRLKVVCFGDRVSFYVDGKYIADAQLPESYLAGNIGFACSGSVVRFDNLVVRAATEAGAVFSESINDELIIPETGIVNPPTVAEYVASAEKPASFGAVTLFSFLEDGTLASADGTYVLGDADEVLSAYGKSTVPAFFVRNDAQASALASYLKEEFLPDSFVVADAQNAQLIENVRSEWEYSRGIYVADSVAETREQAKEFLFAANETGANVILFPAAPTAEIVNYYQARMLTVWTQTSDSVTVYEAIAAGVNGIVNASPDLIYDCYRTFTETTVIRKPIVMAHRGASALYAENTLNSFIIAYEQGADGIETDLYLTTDGEIVLFHDSTLDTLTTGTGSIESYSLAQLKSITVDCFPGVRESIPTLRETFEYFADKDIVFMLEIKSGQAALMHRLAEIVQEFGFEDRIVIMTNNVSQLRLASQLLPQVALGRGSIGEIINPIESDAESIAVSLREMAPDRFQPFPFWYNTANGNWSYLYKFAARGWLSWSSTCNDRIAFDARNLSVYGATSVLTNNFQWCADYLYRLTAKDFTVQANETFAPLASLEGYDGTFPTACKYQMIGGEAQLEECEGGYRFATVGTAVLLPYVDVKLNREEGNDICYRLYGAPVTVKVV